MKMIGGESAAVPQTSEWMISMRSRISRECGTIVRMTKEVGYENQQED